MNRQPPRQWLRQCTKKYTPFGGEGKALQKNKSLVAEHSGQRKLYFQDCSIEWLLNNGVSFCMTVIRRTQYILQEPARSCETHSFSVMTVTMSQCETKHPHAVTHNFCQSLSHSKQQCILAFPSLEVFYRTSQADEDTALMGQIPQQRKQGVRSECRPCLDSLISFLPSSVHLLQLQLLFFRVSLPP